jgi:hypothetical protein
VIVNEMELVGRLGEVDPLSDEALMAAEAILQAAMATATSAEPAQIDVSRHLRNRSGRSRRYLAGVAGAAAAALVVVGAFAVMGGGDSHPTSGTHPAATVPVAGTTIRLAGYSFQLPAGYQTVGSNCGALPPGLTTIPVVGENSFAAAASTSGGCIEALLAAGDAATVPAGAQSVQVGPYQGFVTLGAATDVVLYVEIPAAEGHHDLVLVANGLTANQVVAIAESGLPSSIGPTTPCTTGCG